MVSVIFFFSYGVLKTQGQEKEIWAPCANSSWEEEEEDKGARCCQQAAPG